MASLCQVAHNRRDIAPAPASEGLKSPAGSNGGASWMPRFYFNVHDGKSGLDTQGTDLPDWRTARIEAIRLAGEILKDEASHIVLGDNWRIDVTDHRGLILFQMAILLIDSPVVSQRPPDQEDDAR